MSTKFDRPRARVSAAVALALGATPLLAAAQAAPADEDKPRRLEPVVVTADPLDRSALDALRPVSVLRSEDLRARESTNLAASLAREPGVQSSAYGPGAGRPIIRGMDSARVRIAESGIGVGDVSGVSPDHRVSADTLNSRQVEVLRGPATLLYGSGAIGGLVNIVTDRIPRTRLADAGGEVGLRGTTAERERTATLALDAPLGADAAIRVEGFRQRTGDYALAAPLRDEAGDVIAADRLPNSAMKTASAAVGGAWFDANGVRLGAAVQRYESDYGVPNPEEPVTIALRRSRVELAADTGAVGPFGALRARLAASDYGHTEFEPSGEAGARFTSRGTEGRVELPLASDAAVRVVVGTQFSGGETRGVGEGELPRTGSRALALFAIGERRIDRLRVEAGARVERAEYDVRESYADGSRPRSRSFSLATASVGAAWGLAPSWELAATFTRSQRAPAIEELYFLGAHPATFAFEIGDPALRRETSHNVDLALRHRGDRVRAQVNLFVNRVRDYIHGVFDGSTTDILDDSGAVEETLSNLFYRQADARLHGAEAEVAFGERTGPQARLWADTVRAKLTSGDNAGGNLPRMSPSRVGFDAGWRTERWSALFAATRVFRQDRTSAFDLRDGAPEQATAGYTTLDASASVRLGAGATALTLLLWGRNLTDEDTRVHTSFLKNFAPPPGRSFGVGMRVAF
jgi:iron complex outermembrane receptor protein